MNNSSVEPSSGGPLHIAVTTCHTPTVRGVSAGTLPAAVGGANQVGEGPGESSSGGCGQKYYNVMW